MRTGPILCLFATGVACISLAISAVAKTHHIHGLSPNGRLEVIVSEVHTASDSARITYEVVERRSGRCLLQTPSSYQPDQFELPNFSLHHALETTVSWNKESTLVAVEEINHRHIGEVFVVALDGHARAHFVQLPKKEIVQATGRQWDNTACLPQNW
jgi:hypothetical protein